jgi:hypothetical protein
VSGAATSRGLPAYGTPDALRAIAAALARAAGDDGPARASLERMRAEVEELERLGPIDLDRADRVRAALDRGIEALRAVAREGDAPGLGGWVDAAAAAVDGVDPATPLALQRAPVQDALRALADAALVARR